MARLLCVTGGLLGMLYPSVELARRLVRAGHRVTYASVPEAEAVVTAQGLEFLPLEASRYEDFLVTDGAAGLLWRLRQVPLRRRRGAASLVGDFLARTVRRARPDLLLIDVELHEQVIAAAASGVPVALLNSFVSLWRRPGLPPPHCVARPGVGWQGSKVGMWLLWQALRLRKSWRSWSLGVRRIGCDRVSLLRRLARDGGLDFERETDRGQWLMPFTYRRLPVLTMHAREFEFPHRPLEIVRYVGPMVLDKRPDERSSEAVRAALGRIADSCRSRERRLVYAGFGSFFSTDLDLLRRLIAAAQRNDWELVVSLGGRLDPSDLGPLPESVHAFGWVPQPEVLRHADVAVTHGGINSVDECVLSGVPMLVYCGGETDMAGTTARVVYHGLGVAGDRHWDGPQAMGERVDQLQRDPRFRSNLAKFRSRYEAYAENRVAERAVAALLGRPDAPEGR